MKEWWLDKAGPIIIFGILGLAFVAMLLAAFSPPCPPCLKSHVENRYVYPYWRNVTICDQYAKPKPNESNYCE